MSEWTKIEIRDDEILEAPPNFALEHYVRYLCLQKGMPMTGSIIPQLDTDNYEYRSEQNYLDATTTYAWRKK